MQITSTTFNTRLSDVRLWFSAPAGGVVPRVEMVRDPSRAALITPKLSGPNDSSYLSTGLWRVPREHVANTELLGGIDRSLPDRDKLLFLGSTHYVGSGHWGIWSVLSDLFGIPPRLIFETSACGVWGGELELAHSSVRANETSGMFHTLRSKPSFLGEKYELTDEVVALLEQVFGRDVSRIPYDPEGKHLFSDFSGFDPRHDFEKIYFLLRSFISMLKTYGAEHRVRVNGLRRYLLDFEKIHELLVKSRYPGLDSFTQYLQQLIADVRFLCDNWHDVIEHLDLVERVKVNSLRFTVFFSNRFVLPRDVSEADMNFRDKYFDVVVL